VSGKTAIRIAFVSALAFWLVHDARAAGEFVEDIQISRRDGEPIVAIGLACPMRLRSDFSSDVTVLIEIHVLPLDDCRRPGIGGGIATETYRPVGRQLAYLSEVEYESLGLGDATFYLRFDRPVRYQVAQRGNLRLLELTVEAAEGAKVPDGRSPRDRATVEQQAAPRRPERGPTTVRTIEPAVRADYMINLQSTREAFGAGVVESIVVPEGIRVYVSQIEVDGQTWYRLRLGFFASELRAREILESLSAAFPRAWIGRAEPEEIRLANASAGERGALIDAARPSESETAAVAAAPVGTGGTLSEERRAAMLEEARQAILDANFETAIQLYTRLLEAPGAHLAEAREYLGVAREKNGQLAHARAEYQTYLAEHPVGEGAERVRQRLNGLLMASAAPREPLRQTRSTDEARWEVGSSVSQYYPRDVNQFDEDQDEIVTLSTLLSDIDLTVRRSGRNLDVLGRIAVDHMYDLIGEQDNGPGDQNRVSYAYIDIDDVLHDWSLRLGRQSLHNWGVLGRFDGAHLSYDWATDRRVHYMTGYPVESTRDSLETNRQFHGAGVDFDGLIGAWDLSTFVTRQTIDGVIDRQALGIEANYVGERRRLTSMLDYDTHYGELNTVLVLGTWRLANRMTLNALVDYRLSPVLTTRNALIGQPVTAIDELLLVWTEERIQELALDRTARSKTTTLGFTTPLAERFQLNADVTVTELDATIASGGVAEVPSLGTQTYLSTTLIGSGLFGTGDVNVFNLRYGESENFKISQLSWDARFRIGQRMRLNPRLRLAAWESLLDGRRRETIGPSFRFLFNSRKHYRLEFEVGKDQFTRTDVDSTQIASDYYINLGYRMDF
jgi:hypothetical protein